MIVYKTYEEIPTSVADFILTASGETNIKQVPLKDINGFVEMMEGVDSGAKEVNTTRTWRSSYGNP